MTQEDKELLLKDLCARLPYSVKLFVQSWDEREMEYIDNVDVLYSVNGDSYIQTVSEDYIFSAEDIKPYLFPLSSMTEEQKQELRMFGSLDAESTMSLGEWAIQLVDFYNKYHLDYRNLIPKGLAIDATGLNIY